MNWSIASHFENLPPSLPPPSLPPPSFSFPFQFLSTPSSKQFQRLTELSSPCWTDYHLRSCTWWHTQLNLTPFLNHSFLTNIRSTVPRSFLNFRVSINTFIKPWFPFFTKRLSSSQMRRFSIYSSLPLRKHGSDKTDQRPSSIAWSL